MSTMWVNGLVAHRDKMPYVQILKDENIVCQMSVAQAFNFARDIIQSIARVEADAMLLKFFDRNRFPSGAAGALLMEFRDFRAELDKENPRDDTRSKGD